MSLSAIVFLLPWQRAFSTVPAATAAVVAVAAVAVVAVVAVVAAVVPASFAPAPFGL